MAENEYGTEKELHEDRVTGVPRAKKGEEIGAALKRLTTPLDRATEKKRAEVWLATERKIKERQAELARLSLELTEEQARLLAAERDLKSLVNRDAPLKIFSIGGQAICVEWKEVQAPTSRESGRWEVTIKTQELL